MAGTVVMALINICRIDYQAYLSIANFFFTMISLVVICYMLMTSNVQRRSITWIFTSSYNNSGFTNFPYVVCTATLTVLFSIAGYEGPSHLAEETLRSRSWAPWSIVINIFCTCVVGFIYVLVLLINTPSLNDDDNGDYGMFDTRYGNSAIQVMVDCVGSEKASGLTLLLVIMAFMGGLTNITVTSRICYAMARDGAFPCSKWLSEINSVTNSPLNMVVSVTIFTLVLLCVPLGNQYAFTGITSVSIIGYQASYIIPLVLRLVPGRFEASDQFRLGIYSIPLVVTALLFLCITSIVSFFPQQYPIWTTPNFPWVIIIAPCFLLLGAVYWVLYAKYHFQGPPQHTLQDEREAEEEDRRGENNPYQEALRKIRGAEVVETLPSPDVEGSVSPVIAITVTEPTTISI